MQPLSVSLVQTDLYWENPVANLAMLEEKISALSNKTDLIVLPEMFNSGFSMNYAEPVNFNTHKWMLQMASRHQTTLAGSVATSDGGKFYNRLLWAGPSGSVHYYDKKHLFRYGGEDSRFSPGQHKLITSVGDFKVMPLICYDLRFPVWSRNTKNAYDLLIYVASWPEVRIEAWKALLKARAIENQCFVVGVNRIGTDGNGLKYNGQSAVIDFTGKLLYDCGDQEDISTVSLDIEALSAFRSRFPFHEDADAFELK